MLQTITEPNSLSSPIPAGIVTNQLTAPTAPGETDQAGPVKITKLFTVHHTNSIESNCIDFVNVSGQDVRAVQVKFTYFDAFDSSLGSDFGDRVGFFSPGVDIRGADNVDIGTGFDIGNFSQKTQNCWIADHFVSSLSKITAEITKVRYASGEIWTVNKSSGSPFTITLLGGAGTFVTPPTMIECKVRFLKLKYHFSDLRRENPKAQDCVRNWEREHGNVEGWPPYVTESPSPGSLQPH